MKRIALIGNPVSHSLSPLLFRLAYSAIPNSLLEKQYNALIDGELFRYEIVENENCDDALHFLKEEGLVGANITAPFKEKAMEFVSHPDAVTSAIGATNLILFDKGDTYSYNTDYEAAKKFIIGALEELQCEVADILVIGCGGAAKAALYASVVIMKELHTSPNSKIIDNICIANRTAEKALKFKRKIENSENVALTFIPFGEVKNSLKDYSREFSQNKLGKGLIVLYCLPIEVDFAGCLSECGNNTFVIEPNYLNPTFQKYEEAEYHYIGGLQWLIEQAVYGFKLFTAQEPNAAQMLRLKELIR